MITEREIAKLVDQACGDPAGYLKRAAVRALIVLDHATGDDDELLYPQGYLVACGIAQESRFLDMLMKFVATSPGQKARLPTVAEKLAAATPPSPGG